MIKSFILKFNKKIKKQINKLYYFILNNKIDYYYFEKFYENIENELKLFLNKIFFIRNSLIDFYKILLKLWIKYKNEHKDDRIIVDNFIKMNLSIFNELFFNIKSKLLLKYKEDNTRFIYINYNIDIKNYKLN